MISFYKKYISPVYHFIGHNLFGSTFACRFSPTCSEYAKTALHRYGIITGTKLSLWRFIRCQPFFKGGYDPVPKRLS